MICPGPSVVCVIGGGTERHCGVCLIDFPLKIHRAACGVSKDSRFRSNLRHDAQIWII